MLWAEDGIKNSELILGEKEVQNIYYSLNTTAFQELVKWFYNFKEKGENIMLKTNKILVILVLQNCHGDGSTDNILLKD